MKFSAPAAELARAADLAKRCSAKYAPFDRVLITPGPQLSITSASGVAVLRQTIEVPAQGEPLSVPANDFARAAGLFSGEVACAIDAKKARLAFAAKPRRSEIQFALVTNDYEAPRLPAHGDTRDVLAAPLREAIERVKHAVCGDATRPHIHGVLVELVGDRVRALAANPAGLSVFGSLEGEPDAAMFLPAPLLPLLIDLLPEGGAVQFAQTPSHLIFEGRGWTLAGAKAAGEFPGWRHILPQKRAESFSVLTRALTAELAATLAGAESGGDASGRVHLAIEGGLMRLRGSSSDREAESELAVTPTPGDLAARLAISAPLLMGVLGAISTDECTVGLEGPLDPITVTPSDGSALSVLMPMRAE